MTFVSPVDSFGGETENTALRPISSGVRSELPECPDQYLIKNAKIILKNIGFGDFRKKAISGNDLNFKIRYQI